MAAGLVTLNILDGDGTTRTARFWSSDGTSAGLLFPLAVMVDGTTFVPIDFTTGTAGTPGGGVSSVQGVAGMTPVDTNVKGWNGREYETVAASQTAQALGATGATGDDIDGVLVIPATTGPGNVLLLDNATSITVFTGGASSVSNLVPFFIPLGMRSVSGAWKLTTGANVSCIAVGNFT